ncbi:MAG: PEGA domain-containing protein [Polyangiaceae bacterium]
MARRISASFSKVLALAVAGSLATTSALPLAMAQGKAAAGDAKPDPKKRDAARKAYQEGEKAFNAGKYAEAYSSFKKAHDILPSPHAEYWMALALDKQGKTEDAAAAMEKLLASAEVSKLGDEKIGQIKSRLSEIKGKQTGELSLQTNPPGAAVSVDGNAQPGETPMILKLAPGAHSITVTNPGYEKQELKIDVTAGQRVDKNFELKASDAGPAAPAPAPVDTPPPAAEPTEKSEPAQPAQPKSKVPAYVTLGIAGASAAVGAFFGVKALGAKSDFNDTPTTDNADKVERNALIADMAFGVAITLGVTGIVLLTSGDSEPAKEKSALKAPKRARLNVAPYATPHGGGAAARFTF